MRCSPGALSSRGRVSPSGAGSSAAATCPTQNWSVNSSSQWMTDWMDEWMNA